VLFVLPAEQIGFNEFVQGIHVERTYIERKKGGLNIKKCVS